MRLRKLQENDAEFMLEWMHDEKVVAYLNANFKEFTVENALSFIKNSQNDDKNCHMAITNDKDEYFGTVSLKNLDFETKTAEFAITVRSEAMGHGYAWYGMKHILDKAFEDYGLKSVYWCVSKNNSRACRFYEKHNFNKVVDVPQSLIDRYRNRNDLIWFSVLAGDNYEGTAFEDDAVRGCRIIRVETIPTINSGELSFEELGTDTEIGFDVKRVYYISKTPEGVKRGFHSHKTLKQFMFCPYGEIMMTLDDGVNRKEIILNDPSYGLVIDKPVWREMLFMKENSVLCVMASEHYDPDDYIRNYDEFIKYVNGEK